MLQALADTDLKNPAVQTVGGWDG